MTVNCDHKNREIIKIEDGKVEALCGDCNHTLQRDLVKFDLMSLLHQFSEDVCVGCEHIPKCWDGELMVMPEPNFMRYYCKKGAHLCFGEFELNMVQQAAIMALEQRKKEAVGS